MSVERCGVLQCTQNRKEIRFKPSPSPLILFIRYPPSVGVLFSSLAPRSHQHPMSKSGSYTRRAFRIVFPETAGMPYILALDYAQIPSLHSRRQEANKEFFESMSDPSSCIFSLLPPPRDGAVTSRLRSASTYPRPVTRTKRFTQCKSMSTVVITSNEVISDQLCIQLVQFISVRG